MVFVVVQYVSKEVNTFSLKNQIFQLHVPVYIKLHMKLPSFQANFKTSSTSILLLSQFNIDI